MEKVQYGIQCKICGSMPTTHVVSTSQGVRFFQACPKCPQPIQGYRMVETEEEAKWNWRLDNDPEVRPQFLQAVRKAAEFLVLMDADKGLSIPDETVIKAFQAMVDGHVIDLFAAASATAIKLIQAGAVKKPPKIIVPFRGRGKRK